MVEAIASCLHNQTLKGKPGGIYILWLMLTKNKELKIWIQASDFIS